jgi:hypothetical protein
MATTQARTVLNSAGMQAMLVSPGIRADMLSRAEIVAATARASAPVDSGAYRDSITAYDVTTDRAVGRVGSDLPYASLIEANTGNLARALDAAL